MACAPEALCDLYALGVLDEEERLEIEAHLFAGCQSCRREVDGARRVVSRLAWLAPAVEPPPELRRRVLAQM